MATTARSLYRSSGFTLMMNHAGQRADLILIMSAKYGLLDLDDTVAYYDAYLPTLTRAERSYLLQNLKQQVHRLEGLRVLSYLPRAYWEALREINAPVADRMRRPYRSFNMMQLFAVLRHEIDTYGKEPARR